MGLTHQWLLIFLSFSALTSIAMAADLYSLIYKGCANGSLGGGAVAQQAIAAVASALIAQSSTSKFYKASATSMTGQALSGLFQCRGDLSPSDCAGCVSRLTPMWGSLCGASAAAARVQLTGCYALYQIAGFPEVAGTQLLFKTCGSAGGGSGFEEKRGSALSSLQSGLSSGGGGAGFYATSYESVYAMAQCEGDLSAGDCNECVAQAVQKAEVECGGAASGKSISINAILATATTLTASLAAPAPAAPWRRASWR